MTPLAILGATGYTGRLVVDEARRRQIPLRLVGRRRDALEALARPGDEVRVADARDPAALREAFAGAGAVASTAGPFLDVGWGPVEAAIAADAHYLDTSGEQAFARRVYDELDAPARERGVVLLTSFGFDYAPGDLAARLAADELDAVDEIAVAYATTGTAVSRGTLRTLASAVGAPHVTWRDGALVPSTFGGSVARAAFPGGERTVVEWGGTEPLTVPRHTPARTVSSSLRAPAVAARAAAAASVLRPLLRLAARVAPQPGERRRAGSRWTVVAEAQGPGGASRATLVGSDVYRLTARLLAVGAQALLAGEVDGAGALAPAQAFAPRPLAQRLGPLLRIDSVTSV